MRSLAVVPLLVLVAAPVLAQDAEPEKDADEQAKEEARLLKKARRFLENEDKKEALDAFRKVADLARSRDHMETAIAALNEALPLVESTDAEAGMLDEVRWLEFKNGDYAACAKHLERLCELKPDDAAQLSNLGAALHKAGRSEEAVKALEKSLALDSSHDIARFTLGRVARLAGKGKKALKAHEHLVDKARNGQLDAGGWYVGYESKKQKANGKGNDFSAEQKVILIKLEVAIDHAFLDDLEEAEKLLAKLKESATETDFALAAEEGVDDLERALEQRPQHFQLRYLLAKLYEAKGDDESAKVELERFLEADRKVHAFARKAREKLAAAEEGKPEAKKAEGK